MKRWVALFLGMIIDAVVGDPIALPHPVRFIGEGISRGETLVRNCFPATRAGRYEAGATLSAFVVLTSGGVASICTSRWPWSEPFAIGASLSLRSLLHEAGSVVDALAAGDLALARTRVARIVGRDTQQLDAADIARATIETLAESLCDGVVAPLCFALVGGSTGAWLYKSINTLDSMIGHIEEPYRDFGCAAARLDDLANALPARIAAYALVVCAQLRWRSGTSAMGTQRSTARLHRSPNAGQTESAMAGALRVRLGGTNHYDGVAHDGPVFGAAFEPPCIGDIRRAMELVTFAACLSYGAALLAAVVCER
ncbi:MAG: adenosylcobinamide-phosphate synthase CbiB [Vulcanimicrobiaceae bacterium]